jgi:hypothetical protein
MFGLDAVHGLHRQGVPQDEGDALLGTQVSEPVPGAQTCDNDDETVALLTASSVCSYVVSAFDSS